jgi:polysaccharide export outer membrane protein
VVTPHVAQSTSGRGSAIDDRITGHPAVRSRKRVEEAFGKSKTVAGLRKMRHRGRTQGRSAIHPRDGRLTSSGCPNCSPMLFHEPAHISRATAAPVGAQFDCRQTRPLLQYRSLRKPERPKNQHFFSTLLVLEILRRWSSMNWHVRIVWVALVALFPLAGCSPGSDLPVLPAKSDVSSYHLGSGDRLEIKVLGADELNGQYSVQDDGTIRMLLVGAVPAAGLTPDQVQANIEEKLKAGRYLTQPHASVAVLNYRPFYILGEVGNPGGYPYVSGMKVLSAVAAAHGYTYRANQDYVIITRNGEDRKADILSSIQPDDIIRVPERYF